MSMGSAFAAVATGGALGACGRYAVTLLLAGTTQRFPYATLVANLSGAMLAGFLVTMLLSRGMAGSSTYLLLITGFLGSFTTLSAFSVETWRLVQDGAMLAATINVLVTITGALLAAIVGIWIARFF